METATPDRFSDALRKINALHRENSCFHQGGNLVFVDNAHGALLIAYREGKTAEEGRFLLCANLDTGGFHSQDVFCGGWRRPGKRLVFHEMMENIHFALDGDTFRVELPPCGVKAYRLLDG
jgi:hypothetical protein